MTTLTVAQCAKNKFSRYLYKRKHKPSVQTIKQFQLKANVETKLFNVVKRNAIYNSGTLTKHLGSKPY